MVRRLIDAGFTVERSHHEVGTAGQAEINYKFSTLLHAGDQMQLFKYIIKNTAWAHGKTATFMPKPLFGDNGSGMHTHQSLWLGGEPLFYDETGYAGLSDTARWYIGGLLHHAPSLLAFTNPTVNSYRRLVPGYEAPVNLVYSQRNRSACTRIPVTGSNPKAKRVEFRVPDPSSNPYLAFSAMMMAGLDGIKNKIEPPAPIDKDLYDLPPEEWGDVKQVPGSLPAVLDSLEADHDYLLDGGVFTARPDLHLGRLEAGQRGRPGAPAPDPARVRDVLRLLSTLVSTGRAGSALADRPRCTPAPSRARSDGTIGGARVQAPGRTPSHAPTTATSSAVIATAPGLGEPGQVGAVRQGQEAPPTAQGTTNQVVPGQWRAATASSASGQVAYQGWKTGARTTVAASARPAPSSATRGRAAVDAGRSRGMPGRRPAGAAPPGPPPQHHQQSRRAAAGATARATGTASGSRPTSAPA